MRGWVKLSVKHEPLQERGERARPLVTKNSISINNSVTICELPAPYSALPSWRRAIDDDEAPCSLEVARCRDRQRAQSVRAVGDAGHGNVRQAARQFRQYQ